MPFNTILPDAPTWDAFVELRNGHLLQTSAWGRLKCAFGWSSEMVAIRDGEGDIAAGAQVLFRELPGGLGGIAYVPRGPVVDWGDTTLCTELFTAVRQRAARRRAIFLKVEPDMPDTTPLRDALAVRGFRPSPQTVQPPRTIVIDLDDEAAILARMNQGTRRKIRLAERGGISVREGSATDLDSFDALMRVTGERDGFGVHSAAYYRMAFDLFHPRHATLLMASHEGRDLAGLMVFAHGRQAWYLYGASSNDERNLMPTFALQWAAIRWAKARGCAGYDLWGIPDEDEAALEAGFRERHGGLWGVYGFKRGFGGRIVRAVGAWDQVYNPLLYNAYRLLMARRTRGVE